MPSIRLTVCERLGGGEGLNRPGLDMGVFARLLDFELLPSSILNDADTGRPVSHDDV